MATVGALSRLASGATSASAADVVRHDDARLSDARTPTAHAASHHGGSDPVTPAGIGAQPVDSDLTTIAAIAPSNDDVIQRKAGAWTNRTMAQLTTDLGAVPTSRTLTASTGLTGGGSLAADRSFAVSYGSSAGTAVEGSDARVTADQAAGTASIRTLGTGSVQAAAGNHAHTAALVPFPPVTLTDAATIATDASLGLVFRVSIAADRTLGVPSNPTNGQSAVWEVTASGANRILSLTTGSAGAFIFGSDITALTTIVSGKTDFIGAMYNSTVARWRVLAYVKGF